VASDGHGMSRVAISIQTLNGRNDTYLRKEVGTMHKGTILAAVEEMLADQAAHTIGNKTPKPSYQRARALKKAEEAQNDDHIIPGVDAVVEAALT
jgi:hypothetical protein